MRISLGGSFPSLMGGGELKVRRCLTAAERGWNGSRWGVVTGWKEDVRGKMIERMKNMIGRMVGIGWMRHRHFFDNDRRTCDDDAFYIVISNASRRSSSSLSSHCFVGCSSLSVCWDLKKRYADL